MSYEPGVTTVLAVRLILASGSPRRRELLEELGLSPEVRPANIDETPLPGEVAAAYVERLAIEKGAAVVALGDIEPGDVVVSADTIVVLDGDLLGQPENDNSARAMLEALSGRTHDVLTGVAVRTDQAVTSVVETTVVHFAELSSIDIDWYIATGEPADKAGAYALQGRGGAFVTAIEGSYDNVIGLPRHRIRHLLPLGAEWDESAAD